MARTTVDDCLAHYPNHFELVTGVSERARRLKGGEQSVLSEHSLDHPIVHALREVASGKLSINLAHDSEGEQEPGDNFLDENKEGKDYQYPDDNSSEAKT